MRHHLNGRFIMAILVSISLIACKGKDKDKEKEATNDTTKTTEMNNMTIDEVKVARDLYKVLADTMGIRMVEVNYKPGDSSAMHWHPDYAIYVVEGGKVTFYNKDGTSMENELPSGATMIRPAEFHAAKNTG